VLPTVLGVGFGKLSLIGWIDRLLDKIGLGYIDRMPSAWDFVLRQQKPRYIRIHLKDGKGMVGGVYADRSFGSLNPRRADIYLEEAWQLDEDGNFVQAIADSRGIWIAHDVMAYVHLLEREEEPDATQRYEARTEQASGEARHRQEGRATSREGESSPPAADAAYS
jgi:hypothetical protein